MRTSLRNAISPLLLSLLLAAGACGDSSDTATIDGSGAQDETAADGDTGTSDETASSDDTGTSDDTASGDGETAEASPAEPEGNGDGSEESSDPDLKAGLSAWVLESGTYTTEVAEGDCVADGVIQGIGTERLAEVGVTAATPTLLGADLTDDESEIFVDALFECVDMRQSFVDNIVGPDLNEDQANCVVDEMGMDLIRTMTRTGLLAPEELDFDELFDVINAAGEACGVDMDE